MVYVLQGCLRLSCISLYFLLRLDDYVHVLEKEVNIDYCRSMNKIIFDKTVSNDSETFAFVQLPDPEEDPVPERGMVHLTLSNVTIVIGDDRLCSRLCSRT